MESTLVELKLISCKDLKSFNFFQKLSVYALVSIATCTEDDDGKKVNQQQQQQQRTPTDKEGDGNPEWNHKLQFEVSKTLFHDCDNVFIYFDLRHQGVMFGDKTIGQVHVPFKDIIIQDSVSNGAVRFVTYEVRTTDGKPNGMLDFSFKVINNGSNQIQGLKTDSSDTQISGYPLLFRPETEFCSSQVQGCESPKPHYPILEFENILQSPQQTYFLPENTYYQLPPPPPPPPAAMVCGPCYHRPPPPPGPWPNPWGPSPDVGFRGYSAHGSQLESRETWPNGWQGMGNHHSSSSWNGR